jgi:two-component sensor histidine kinase
MVLGSGPFDLAPPADVPLDAMSTSVPELLQSQSLAIGNVFAKPPAGFDAVYITDEMYRRIPKSTDYKREKLALQDLARQMVDHPAKVLPHLVDLAIELCEGISGGISIYETDPPPGVFRWHHLRGDLTKFTGETTPRNFSPCGVTLDLNAVVLSQRPERVYTWLRDADISLAECLLVPLFIGGKEPLGTLWIVSENEGHFDSGHARVMTELAGFAGIALSMVKTEQTLKQTLEQQENLTREMAHRVKNLFAITDGLIHVSAKAASTPAEMSEILSGRMRALAAAHSLVRRNFDDQAATDGADLNELIRKILLPHERSALATRFVVEGPGIRLGDRAATGIALVLHELATNAAKYGALNSDDGSVVVKWREVDNHLILDWTEHGGLVLAGPPVKTGFGTKLSQSTVVGQFEGNLSYDWKPAGLSVAMSMPTAKLSQ